MEASLPRPLSGLFMSFMGDCRALLTSLQFPVDGRGNLLVLQKLESNQASLQR